MYREVGFYEEDCNELVELIAPFKPTPTLPLNYNTIVVPEVKDVYYPHLSKIFTGFWIKAFLSIIWCNGSIMPHRDEDAAGRHRYHLVLQSNKECWCMHDGNWQQLRTGGIYTMDPNKLHASINWGRNPRVHFVVDLGKEL